MTLVDLINQSPYDFYFLVVDKFLDINLPEVSNFHSITSSPHLHNSGQLLAQPSTVDFITQNSKKTGHKPVIVPFKPSAKIEHLCQSQHWLLAANPAKINRLLEDKIKFYQFTKNDFPLVPSAVDSLTPENFTKYQHRFGSSLVIQSHFGWAGKSTYSASKYADISSRLPENTLVKFSQFLPGYSLINNCCLTRFGLLQSPPGLQYTGIPPFTTNPFTTVGRQWPSFSPQNVQDQVITITKKFSQKLTKLNYRGFFGLDFLVHQSRVYLLECNPRLTASFSFYTDIEKHAKIEPLFLYHLAEFINLNYSQPQDRFNNQQIVGSELTPKNPQGKTVNKIHWNYPLSKQTDPIALPHVEF